MLLYSAWCCSSQGKMLSALGLLPSEFPGSSCLFSCSCKWGGTRVRVRRSGGTLSLGNSWALAQVSGLPAGRSERQTDSWQATVPPNGSVPSLVDDPAQGSGSCCHLLALAFPHLHLQEKRQLLLLPVDSEGSGLRAAGKVSFPRAPVEDDTCKCLPEPCLGKLRLASLCWRQGNT